MPELLRAECRDGVCVATLLKEFGKDYPEMTYEKIAQLWQESSKHEVLFSDYTKGKLVPFLAVLMDPRGVWVELANDSGDVIGVAYMTDVVLRFDALIHVAFWDGHASGREPLVWDLMRWGFERYALRRMSAMVPPYQSGLIRFVKRVGFQKEGEKREGVIHKGSWLPLLMYGILREELDSVQEKALEAAISASTYEAN